jgi:hypothetical protein
LPGDYDFTSMRRTNTTSLASRQQHPPGGAVPSPICHHSRVGVRAGKVALPAPGEDCARPGGRCRHGRPARCQQWELGTGSNHPRERFLRCGPGHHSCPFARAWRRADGCDRTNGVSAAVRFVVSVGIRARQGMVVVLALVGYAPTASGTVGCADIVPTRWRRLSCSCPSLACSPARHS